MVSNGVLLKGLRSLGYKFKKTGKKTDIYKKSGRTDRVMISRRSSHSREYVERVLAPPPAKTKSVKKKS